MDTSQAAKLLSDKITDPHQRAALNVLLEELDSEVRTPPLTPEASFSAGRQWTDEQVDALLNRSDPGGLPASDLDIDSKARTLARWMVFFWEGMNTAERNAYIPYTVGAVEHVEHYVGILSDHYDADIENYANREHPGVYEYEVMEELGRWVAMRSWELNELIDSTALLREAQHRAIRFYTP